MRRYVRNAPFPNDPGPQLQDARRTYRTGFSYGAGLAHRIGDASIEIAYLRRTHDDLSDALSPNLLLHLPDSDAVRVTFNYVFP